MFVGNDITYALDRLRALQAEMDARYAQLDAALRRKIDRIDGLPVILCAIDELAYFSVTIGSKDQQEEFKTLVRDLVARGRAAGIIVVAATQRPSADIIPTSLRDLFGYRVAFRCTTDSIQRHHPVRRLGPRGLLRQGHRPRTTRRRLAARRGRHPAADQGRLPDRPPDPPGGRPRPDHPAQRRITASRHRHRYFANS